MATRSVKKPVRSQDRHVRTSLLWGHVKWHDVSQHEASSLSAYTNPTYHQRVPLRAQMSFLLLEGAGHAPLGLVFCTCALQLVCCSTVSRSTKPSVSTALKLIALRSFSGVSERNYD